MTEQTIGTCSICGGSVVGWVGAWHAVIPPPPARCASCGATEARHGPVIPMVPAIQPRPLMHNPSTEPDGFWVETDPTTGLTLRCVRQDGQLTVDRMFGCTIPAEKMPEVKKPRKRR